MSTPIVLTVLNEFGHRDKMRGFFEMSLIISLYRSTSVRLYLWYDIKITLKSHFWRKKI